MSELDQPGEFFLEITNTTMKVQCSSSGSNAAAAAVVATQQQQQW
jgi:hypothetical protein